MSHQAPPIAGDRAPSRLGAAGCVTAVPAFFDHLENVIHDHVLQSLSVCRLQVELCQYLWGKGETEQAFGELQVLVQELTGAVEALRHVTGDLSLASSLNPQPATSQ
jgi:hypothetical protein